MATLEVDYIPLWCRPYVQRPASNGKELESASVLRGRLFLIYCSSLMRERDSFCQTQGFSKKQFAQPSRSQMQQQIEIADLSEKKVPKYKQIFIRKYYLGSFPLKKSLMFFLFEQQMGFAGVNKITIQLQYRVQGSIFLYSAIVFSV